MRLRSWGGACSTRFPCAYALGCCAPMCTAALAPAAALCMALLRGSLAPLHTRTRTDTHAHPRSHAGALRARSHSLARAHPHRQVSCCGSFVQQRARGFLLSATVYRSPMLSKRRRCLHPLQCFSPVLLSCLDAPASSRIKQIAAYHRSSVHTCACPYMHAYV